jgi:esterase/lipase
VGNRPGAERLGELARAIKIPVLFLFQWDDELMQREHGMALFDAIGSDEKTMHVNPGGHIQMPAHERDAVEAFFRRHIPPPV